MIFDIGLHQLDIDVERTAEFYKRGNGILCDCDGCRNYEQAVGMLPAPARQFLHQFGIDPAKPAEVYVNYAPSSETLHYGGFYHLCGTILKGGEPWVKMGDRSYQLDDRYRIGLCETCFAFFTREVSIPDDDFPKPIIQMEIEFILPWVLNKPNSYL